MFFALIGLLSSLAGLARAALEPQPVAAQATADVELLVSPAVAQQNVGDVFTVAVLLTDDQSPTDGVEFHLVFDPSRLLVTDAAGDAASSITTGSAFDLTLENRADNTTGRIDFTSATLGPTQPHSSVKVAELTFKAIAPSDASGASITFMRFGAGSTTRATLNGAALPVAMSDGVVLIGGSPPEPPAPPVEP